MKKTIIAFIALMSVAITAVAETKIAVVQFSELFDSYYKTKEVSKRLESNQQRLQEQVQEERQALQSLAQEIQTLRADAQNSMFTDEKREEKRKTAEEKQIEAQRRQEDIQRWGQQFQRQFQKERNAIIEELRGEVAKIAESKGYDFVLDSSNYPDSPSLVVFHKDAVDITDSVVTTVNKDAPQN